jgi:hypothetical protein
MLNKTGNVRITSPWGEFVQSLLQWKKQWILHIMSMFVALGIQNELRMRHIVVCSLSGYTIFFHIIS